MYICNQSTCSVTRTEDGYQLVVTGATNDAAEWTFKPTNPSDRLMESLDNVYASYGWWLRKSADDSRYDASAFAAYRGNEAERAVVEADLLTLQGTATYSGGAAGKYALYNPLSGPNDAGHFTAKAMLEVDFRDEAALGTIKGSIDGFMDADGMDLDWSVELKQTDLYGNGLFGESDAITTEALWTINGIQDESPGDSEWKGSFHEVDPESDVPGVAIGTFYTEFSGTGKMVGGFGANRDKTDN